MTMTEYKYKLRKCMAVLLSLSMTAGCAISGSVAAQAAGTPKEVNSREETVFIVADINGNPTKEIVSAWLKNPEEKDQLVEESNLTDIELTKGEQEYRTEDGKLVWQANGSDIHYQGKTDKALPVDTSITYTLDGKEVGAEELAGANGHLVMTIRYQNHTGEKKMVGGKAVTMYQPFMAVSSVMLDNTRASGITVDHGKVMNTGEQTVVVGMAMPGLKESLGLEDLKDQDGKAVDLGFGDTVTIEADVTDFTLLTTLTMFDNSALQELNLDKLDDLKNLDKDLSKLTDAADQLEDGTKELADGSGDLSDGAGQLLAGIEALDKGAEELAAGIDTARDGSVTLKDGIDTAADGVVSLATNLQQLAEGASGLSSNMPAYVKGMKALKSGTVTLKKGAKDYTDGVDSFIDNSTNAIKQLAAGADQLSALENLGQISSAVNKINSSLGDAKTEQTLVYGNTLVSAGLTELNKQLSLMKDSTEAENLAKLGQGLGSMKSGIDSANQVIQSAQTKLGQDSAALQSEMKTVNGRIEKVNANVKAYNKGLDAVEKSREDLKAEANKANDQIASANREIDDAISALEEAAAATEDEEAKAKIQSRIQSLKGISVHEVSEPEVAVPEKLEAVEELDAYDTDLTGYAVYQGTLGKISGGLEAGMAQIPSSIDNSSIETLATAVSQLSAGAQANAAGIKQLAEGVALLKKSSDQLPAAAEGFSQLHSGLGLMAKKNSTFLNGGKSLKEAGPQILAGIDSLKDGEVTLIEGAKSIESGAAALADGSGQLYDGSKVLNQGMSALASGASELGSGMGQLSDGAGALTAGTKELADGGKALNDGAQKLQDGADQLKDGMKEFNQEGIARLTELLNENVEGLADRVKVLQEFSKEYQSFAGAEDNTDGTVRFILRTDAIGE